MKYTITKLSSLSGVSSRTLRFYDEIDLLKPIRSKSNNYRYYDEEKLLLLQQILFFRELGFSLNDIKGFLSDPNFDKAETLAQHRILLQESLEKSSILIKTIDKTLSYLKGENKMNSTKLYEGFHKKIQLAADELSQEMMQIYQDAGIENDELKKIAMVQENLKGWSFDDWNQINLKIRGVLNQCVEALENNYSPDSKETQSLIDMLYNINLQFCGNISKRTYYLLFSQSMEIPQSLDFYHTFHPKLLAYLCDAVKTFSEH